jgi:hypothetical protein
MAVRVVTMRKISEPIIAVIATWVVLNITEAYYGGLAAWALGTFFLLIIGIILLRRHRK